ncbi:MAG: hypothetical protein ABI649_03020 [Gaiellaceae bacterium]
MHEHAFEVEILGREPVPQGGELVRVEVRLPDGRWRSMFGMADWQPIEYFERSVSDQMDHGEFESAFFRVENDIERPGS